MVSLKLAFTGWFFYNRVTLITLYKIWYLNLDKAVLFPRNQVICLKNWNLWQGPTTIKFNFFFLKFCTDFLLSNVYKRVFRIFLFCLDLKSLIEIKKKRACRKWVFFIFANNSRYKQNKKKSWTCFCRHW